jgi:hypothetical protein
MSRGCERRASRGRPDARAPKRDSDHATTPLPWPRARFLTISVYLAAVRGHLLRLDERRRRSASRRPSARHRTSRHRRSERDGRAWANSVGCISAGLALALSCVLQAPDLWVGNGRSLAGKRTMSHLGPRANRSAVDRLAAATGGNVPVADEERRVEKSGGGAGDYWSRGRELNPRPTDYELVQTTYSGYPKRSRQNKPKRSELTGCLPGCS